MWYNPLQGFPFSSNPNPKRNRHFGTVANTSTQYVQYLVYAVLSVHSWSWHAEIVREYLTSGSQVIVQWRTRKREMRWDGTWLWETGT